MCRDVSTAAGTCIPMRHDIGTGVEWPSGGRRSCLAEWGRVARETRTGRRLPVPEFDRSHSVACAKRSLAWLQHCSSDTTACGGRRPWASQKGMACFPTSRPSESCRLQEFVALCYACNLASRSATQIACLSCPSCRYRCGPAIVCLASCAVEMCATPLPQNGYR